MQTKKVPLRMCSGCGEMKTKRELIRVVKNNLGEMSLDLTGKKAGRGAYVCNNLDCFIKARKSRRFEKSFRCQIPNELYDQMEQELKQHEQNGENNE